ncbi:MAG: NUDIX domain-containing protein [candidate division WWE3 bacterium]|nr:NUDIX domain-containing protein [candidate division WWE3 bacterium]
MKTKSDRALRPQVVLVNRAVVLRKDGKILIIQRAANDTYMPNKWELPGGKLDAGQDISIALEREILEETGLVVVPVDKMAYFHSEIISSGKYKGLPYIILIGLVRSIGGDVLISNEHRDFKWLTVKEALNYDLIHDTKSALCVLSDKIRALK